MCCVDGDCPSDPAGHRSGICSGSGCAYKCDSGYKACAGACIANAACCGSDDCKTPPNGCYKATGSCNAGSCAYAYNDGATCDADHDACTPNDSCLSGACVADTAHLVVCLQRECHSAPTCNKTSGNCEDMVTSGACGGNGCTPAGTCSNGQCSTGSQTKDCSSQDAVCKVGQCNIATGDCAAVNQPNGTTCAAADRCIAQPACNGGTCTGTRTECTPSGACRVADCNATTGGCEETVAPVGTSCSMDGSCIQNPSCDATGNCVGSPVADGSPCDNEKCTQSAACAAGVCVCLENPDFGSGPVANPPADMAETPPEDPQAPSGGCSMTGTPNGVWGFWLVIGLLCWMHRRRPA
jgi:hypothetical protein